jgi:outer membrane protein assembly factor BamB
MTDDEQYDDPVLAHRVHAWVKDAAPSAAPERLVYAVMDEVERTRAPRKTSLGPIRLLALWQYVALTVVIAIGVAAGTLATRPTDTDGGPSPGLGPSPAAPSRSPAPGVPSLPTIKRYDLTFAPGPSAIGRTGSSLWVGMPDRSIVELDASTGEQLSTTSVGVEPITIVQIDGLLWIGSGGADLIWMDPTSHRVGSIKGAGGPYVLAWDGSIWVSRKGEFLRVDPSSRRIVGSLPVPGHAAHFPSLVVGDELWAGSGSGEIVRLALPSGTARGTIPLYATDLVATSDGVLAVAAGNLYRIATSSGPVNTPLAILDGLPPPYGQVLDGQRLWLAGNQGDRGEVVEIDLGAGRIISRTSVGRGVRALAVVDGSVWVAVDSGALVRLQASP